MSNVLEEVHAASKPLVQEMVASHQHNEDFIRGLRFLMSVNAPEGEESPFLKGFADLLVHMETMRRVALSYHQAVGECVRQEQK